MKSVKSVKSVGSGAKGVGTVLGRFVRAKRVFWEKALTFDFPTDPCSPIKHSITLDHIQTRGRKLRGRKPRGRKSVDAQ